MPVRADMGPGLPKKSRTKHALGCIQGMRGSAL